MRRLPCLPALLLVALLVSTGRSHAFCPDGWVMLNTPYAYSHDQFHWLYVNPGGSMACYDYAAATWLDFPADLDGWVFFDWPHGFALNTGRWYYFNAADNLLCYNMCSTDWTLFGARRYSNADAWGTWLISEIMVEATTQDILTGWVGVTAINAFSGYTYDGAGTEDDIQGFAFVDNVGVADIDITAMPDPQPLDVDAWKSHAVCAHTGGGGSYAYMYAIVRRGDAYSNTDLPGTWVLSQVSASGTGNSLTTGPVVVDGALNFTAYFSDKLGNPDIVTGTCSVNTYGTTTVVPDGMGAMLFDMSATKDVLLSAWMEGATANFGVMVKRAATYTMADAVGTWRYSLIDIGSTTQQTERGTICIYSDGTGTMRTVDWDGDTHTDSGPISVAADGLVTLGSRQLQLNASHSVMTGCWVDGSSVMLVFCVRNLE